MCYKKPIRSCHIILLLCEKSQKHFLHKLANENNFIDYIKKTNFKGIGFNYSWIYDSNGNKLINYVIRYENIAVELKSFLSNILKVDENIINNIDFENILNKTNRNDYIYKDDPEYLKFIIPLIKKDLGLFEYKILI